MSDSWRTTDPGLALRRKVHDELLPAMRAAHESEDPGGFRAAARGFQDLDAWMVPGSVWDRSLLIVDRMWGEAIVGEWDAVAASIDELAEVW